MSHVGETAVDYRGLSSQIQELAQVSSGSYRAHADPHRVERLERVIWTQVVPRLSLLHGEAAKAEVANPPTPEEIEAFGKLVVAGDNAAAVAYFQQVAARGHSFDSLFETLLAPTARHLGELWEQDQCDFLDVTLGVVRLQELLDVFGAAAGNELRDVKRRSLLIAGPEESHVFGLRIIEKFLLAASWDVQVHDRLPLAKNLDAVASEWIGVVGLTVGRVEALNGVARTITALRRASFNPAIAIVVGGHAFHDAPEFVARVGADALAADGPTAVLVARRLLARGVEMAAGRRSGAAGS